MVGVMFMVRLPRIDYSKLNLRTACAIRFRMAASSSTTITKRHHVRVAPVRACAKSLGRPLIQINGWPAPFGVRPLPGLDADMMAQPTVVVVVDDNAGILKSVARLLAVPNTK